MTRSSVNAIMSPNAMFRLPPSFLCLLAPHHMRHLVPSLSICPESHSGILASNPLNCSDSVASSKLCAKRTNFKIPFPYTSLFPSLQKTNDEPRTNQGTPKELPIIKKCFLLILTTSLASLSITAPIALGHLPRFLCPLLPALHAGISRSSLLISPQSYWGTWPQHPSIALTSQASPLPLHLTLYILHQKYLLICKFFATFAPLF